MAMSAYFISLILGLWFMMGYPKFITILAAAASAFLGLILLTTPIEMNTVTGGLFMGLGQVTITGLIGLFLIKIGVYDY